jgi:hypothetical protein
VGCAASSMRSAIYFLDTALANAFVARWCIGYRAGT